MKRSFKTEVFLTIPLTFVALGCICASFLSNQWVSGSAMVENSDFEISYNYGLFWGQKTRVTESTKSFDITGNQIYYVALIGIFATKNSYTFSDMHRRFLYV